MRATRLSRRSLGSQPTGTARALGSALGREGGRAAYLGLVAIGMDLLGRRATEGSRLGEQG